MVTTALEITPGLASQGIAPKVHRNVLACALPALILTLICLLPYLDKPFTVDDPLFLQEARQILVSPLHPMAAQICWNNDNLCGPLAGTAPINLLMSYVLTIVVATGSHEWVAHLLQIALFAAGILATVSLGFRFGFDRTSASWVGIILAAAPPALAMASTAMPDILAMSLGVIGVERLVCWRQEGRTANGILSALALGLAAFTRLHMALLWPCCILLLRDDGQVLDTQGWRALKRRWWPVVGAAVICGIALLLTREPATTVGPASPWVSMRFVTPNARVYLLHWILAMPLGVAWLIFRARRIHPAGSLVLAPFGLWCVRKVATHHTMDAVWLLLSGLGALVLIDILVWSLKTFEQRRIFCALWLLIPLAAIEYIHVPVKLLVPCAPAAALLIVDFSQNVRWRAAGLAAVVGASLIWAGMVLHADAKFADMGRDAAARLVKPEVAKGARVWVASQWGFQWYASKAGAKPLWTNQVPAPGDYLVRGTLEGYKETISRLPPAVLVDVYSVGGPGGRTMSRKDNAGLYSNYIGMLMWAWGTGEWNRYELWRFADRAR